MPNYIRLFYINNVDQTTTRGVTIIGADPEIVQVDAYAMKVLSNTFFVESELRDSKDYFLYSDYEGDMLRVQQRVKKMNSE